MVECGGGSVGVWEFVTTEVCGTGDDGGECGESVFDDGSCECDGEVGMIQVLNAPVKTVGWALAGLFILSLLWDLGEWIWMVRRRKRKTHAKKILAEYNARFKESEPR